MFMSMCVVFFSILTVFSVSLFFLLYCFISLVSSCSCCVVCVSVVLGPKWSDSNIALID